jgi:hypothetical protein
MKYGDIRPGDTLLVDNAFTDQYVYYTVLGICPMADVCGRPSRTFHVLLSIFDKKTMTTITSSIEIRNWYIDTDLPSVGFNDRKYCYLIRGSDG